MDLILGVGVPVFLAFAGWLGFVHKKLMSAASREALQEHRLSVLETRVNAQSEKLDTIISQLARLTALIENGR